LCCIAGWLGELGRRTRIGGDAQGVPFHRGDYVAAVMRGFLGYLAILTGFVVVGSGINVFVTPSPESYVRLAAIVSLAGFLVGFNPALFSSLAEKIVGKAIPDSTKTTVVAQVGAQATNTEEEGKTTTGANNGAAASRVGARPTTKSTALAP
jgi:hypothetical protein